MITPDFFNAGLQVLVASFTSLIEGGVGVVERVAGSIFDNSERLGLALMPDPLHPIVELNHAFARKTVQCWANTSRALMVGISRI
ncbi:MAG TPA: hypothetical protein VGI47_05130 [Candidatus Binataceae bacterium]